jgi:hypothetical protein
MRKGWIGVDLDGTLAFYDYWRGSDYIGPPIPAMLKRVKQWLSEGVDVRIFTARVDGDGEAHCNVEVVEGHIRRWCLEHVGRELPVTCKKDFGMIELWDDRCVQVVPNTGRTIADDVQSQRTAPRRSRLIRLARKTIARNRQHLASTLRRG